MKQGHLATAAFWIGLLSLFGWQASAQIPAPPRPPMPIPTQPRITIRPAPIPAKLTPPPVTAPISPFPVALPPVEFDHPYTGKLTVLKQDDYLLIRELCRDVPTAIACSYRVYDIASGKPISCLIMLGPMAHNDQRVMQHELGHCNGWSNDHERARYGD